MVEISGGSGQQARTQQSGPVAKAFGFLFLLSLVVLAAVVLYRIYPAHLHEKANSGFIDNIFGANLVVFAARVVLLSAGGVLAVAAVFIVISFWMRGKAGHWMARFGPSRRRPSRICKASSNCGSSGGRRSFNVGSNSRDT